MFKRKPTDEPSLNNVIMRVLSEMETYGPDSEEYPTMLAYLERLSRVQTEDRPRRVSPDTMATVAGNLCGILVIVAYEQRHVMTSKGLSFVMKPK
jgi:hypothetical protein